MVQIEINGVGVDFPFEPYKCQIDYMRKVITCLQEQKNGVLESPTGTGKTLCLLCAALAWRETFVAGAQLSQSVMKTENPEYQKNLEETLSSAVGKGIKQFVPKIIYASRTHSQLSQAVNELKNTIYRPKISVLGSRDQMCINPDVFKLDGSTAKVYACKAKISSRSCMYYNNLEAQKENTEFSDNVLDIEDLSRLGDKHKVCPYFMSRELRNNADLIFMPYNYVLDFKSRQANSIDLNGSIILLDEAHNVEKMCEESASFDLTSFDLACCIEDCDACVDILKEKSSMVGEDEEGALAGDLTPEDALRLKMIFSNIEKMIEETKLTDEKFQKEGSYLYQALDGVKINASTVMQILEVIDKCNTLLASNVSNVHKGKHFAMQKMADILKILYCRTGEPTDLNLETSRFYKVFIHSEKIPQFQRNKLDIWKSNDKAKKTSGRTLSYWCFHPGLSMKELVRHGVRSLILTSGTLSPLDSFTSELDVPFPIQLQNPHVINSKQIWAGVITKGPDGVVLNSSYHTRSTDKYLSSLGNLLANMARTTPSGLLVFFPSYPVMDKSIEFWQNNGVLKRIEQNKAYFSEPRNKKMLNETMEQFYDKIKDPALKGAIFFAVCRGKVSEGLDFANENGRVVVITGLPFPPKMDPKVELKMQYLDNPKKKSSLTGRQWYRQQASRAVNQAIGRVIRHSQDYGAICLCDVRFTYPDAQEQLPIWIKPHVKTYQEFGAAQRNVIQFFRIAQSFVTPLTGKKQDTAASGNAICDSDKGPKYANTSDGSNSLVRIHTKSSSRQRPAALSNYNSNASSSLAALKGGEKLDTKGSVFASLSCAGQKKNVVTSTSSSSMSAAIFNAKDNIATVEESRGKVKKMKMVMRKPDDAFDCTNAPKPVKSDMEQAKVAEKYFLSVKDSLPADEYKKFGKILLGYKKRSHDIHYLIKGITWLFRANIESHHVLEGLSAFVKEEHKLIFIDALDKFKTEVQMCLRQSVKVSQFKEPEQKRQKLSSVKENEEKKETKHSYDDFFPTLSDEELASDDEAAKELLAPSCIVCSKKANGPHKAPCGHIACYRCWLMRLKKEKKCPKCGKEIRHRGLQKIFFS